MNGRNVLMAIGGMMITAGIGFIAGSKWTEKKLSCKLEDLYSKEYDLLKKNLENKFEAKENELKEKYGEVEEPSVDDSDGKDDISDNEKDEIIENEPYDDPDEVFSNPVRRMKRSDSGKSRNNYTDLVENDEFEEPEDGSGRTEPYIIDYDTYFQEQDYIDKPLTYDWQNHILIDDENGNVIEEPDLVVGWNNLEEFEEMDDCLIYIRDDSLKIDYVVEKMDYRM